MAHPPASERESGQEQPLQVLQIIAGSLLSGVLTFLTITFVIRSGKGLFAPQPWEVVPPGGMLTAIGLAMAALMIVLAFVVPRQVASGLRKQIAPGAPSAGSDAFFGVYQTQMILGLALLEGAAFFNAIAFLLEGHIPSLLAFGVLVALMLARFPTRAGVASWVEDQAGLWHGERHAG